MKAPRGLGGKTTSSFSLLIWRGTSGTASGFRRILAPLYPYSSSWAGSRWIWSLVKWSEHRRWFFVGTKASRLQNTVHAFLRTVSLGNVKKLFPHPFRCTLEQPNAAQYTIITISNPIMTVNLFVTVLWRDNWLDKYKQVLSRLLASLTDWHLWRHTYGAKTCRVKYAYYEIQTLNCQNLKHVAFWTKRSTRVI